MRLNLSEDEEELLKKRNRARKLSPKLHKIAHESGRSTKELYRRIIKRARGDKK